MENKEQEKKDKVDNDINTDSDVKRIITDDFEMALHIKEQKNPAELLNKLYLLRNKTDLSNEEKNEEMKKIMIEYMR